MSRPRTIPDETDYAALWGEWDRLDASSRTAISDITTNGKGVQGLLKAPSPGPVPALLAASLRDARLRGRASQWRSQVIAALTVLQGDSDMAAMLFAAWIGQSLWEGYGDKGFKMKDLLKRLS